LLIFCSLIIVFFILVLKDVDFITPFLNRGEATRVYKYILKQILSFSALSSNYCSNTSNDALDENQSWEKSRKEVNKTRISRKIS